ncbi:hypothetical protein GR215_33065 [Rhizobium leguminosarum]|uniref:hypothetical protein n=1 Tax=Rhizobium leguminosarum TaxID=384 RepID=UPI0013B9B800|nr:hypothetical protein [Rhizobium leguminosarum]NEH46633.1 hypothetical protein [Rhizobium leguminosarum]
MDEILELVGIEQRLTAQQLREAKRRARYPKPRPGLPSQDELEALDALLSTLARELNNWGVGNGIHQSLSDISKAILSQIAGKIRRRQFAEALVSAQNIPRRWQRDAVEFKERVRSILHLRGEAKYALFSAEPSAAITTTIGRWFAIEPHGKNPAALMRESLGHAGQVESWEPNAAAILYWMGQKAEHDVITQLPAEPGESNFNGDVVASLKAAARSEGRKIASALGYDNAFPIEIGVLETEKTVVEPNTGADFIIVAYLGQEDGHPIVCATVVQGKMENEKHPFVTNIYRSSGSFGRNHQIRALTAPHRDGYYLIYPRNVRHRPLAIAPGQALLREVLCRNPGEPIETLTKSKCEVRYEDVSIDLATFLGKVLVQPRNRFSSIGAALAAIGAPVSGLGPKAIDVQYLLAKRLVLIELGARAPQHDLDYVEALGFRRKPDEDPSYNDVWSALGS